MGERLELSWERIRGIPEETDQSTLHGVFFASLLNLFGNIIGFAPLGFLLPSFSRRCRRYWYNTIMAGYLLSFAVELIQLVFRAGSCDVDDIILNTLGTAVGYFSFLLVQRRRRKRRKIS